MNKKRFFAWLLTLCMIVTIMPVTEHSHVHEHSHAHAEDACTHENASVEIAYIDDDYSKFVLTLSCQCTVEVAAVKSVEPATCKAPETITYTAEGYPKVQWIEEGDELADHDWANFDAKCTVCGEQHAHDTCGYPACTICGYQDTDTHPDNLPKDGHCDNCKVCLMTNAWAEWKNDAENHWYEHVCGEKDLLAAHIWENGVCTFAKCGYECEHPSYTDGECDVCDVVCEHEWDGEECTVCGAICEHEWDQEKLWVGECVKCGGHHTHTTCGWEGIPTWNGTGICDICGYDLYCQHPDYFPCDGKCDVCEGLLDASQDKDGNNFNWMVIKYDATHHWKEHVALPGEVEEGTYEEHKGGTATCTELAKCEVCDQPYGDFKHNWATYDGVCTICGEGHTHDACVFTASFGGNWNCTICGRNCAAEAADVDNDGHCDNGCGAHLPGATEIKSDATHHWEWCEDCQKIIGDWGANGYIENATYVKHTWENGVCTFAECAYACQHSEIAEGKCTVCGEDCPHTEWKDGICTKCGAECDHNYDIEYVPSIDAHTHVLCCANCESPLYGGTPVGCTDYSDYNGFCDKCALSIYHFGGEATCTEKAKCELCGKEHGQTPAGHDWANADGTCTVCDEYHIHDVCMKIYEDTGKTHCTICGANVQWNFQDIYPEDGHCDNECGACLGNSKFPLLVRHDETYHWEECSCGEQDTKRVHTWENGVCTFKNQWGNACGYECPHNYVFEHIEGTATHDWYCTVCDVVLVNGALCINGDDGSNGGVAGDGICDKCGYEYEHKNCRGGEATCTNKAVCEVCFKEYGDDPSHTYEYAHIEGTEDKGSKHIVTCSVCEEVIFIEWYCSDDDADNYCDECGVKLHTHDWSKKDGVCAGCGEECEHANVEYISDKNGRHSLECLDCGLVYIEGACYDYDNGLCDACGYELFHNWSNNDGVCANCGEECEHEAGHKAIAKENKQHILVCPTCGHNFGGMLLNCGDSDGDRYCDSCGNEVYHLHDWSNKDGVCATCGEECEHTTDYISNGEGQHTLLCTICDVEFITGKCYSYDDGLCDACDYELYHYSKNPATCTEGAVCDHCGEAYADALDHDWTNKDGICARCGEECEHPNEKAVSNGEGQHMLECPDCGNTYGDLLLNCENYDTDYNGVCNSCNYEIYHTGGTPTCTEKAICQNCGEAYGETLPHNMELVKTEPATCLLPAYYWYDCTECDYGENYEDKTGALADHVNVDGNNKCDVCGEKLVVDCDHEGTETFIFTIEANCSKEGLVQEFCAVCEEMISEEVLAKNDNHFFHDGKCLLCGETDECKHNNLTMVKSEPATCQYAAYVWYVCDDCGWEMGREEGVADPDAHNYKELKSEPATCQYAKYVWYVCEDCGFEMGREEGVADPKAHNYKELKSEPATCQYAKYVWYVCEDCGFEMGREEGVADPKAHNYKELKSEPATCQYAKYVWYVCEDCGFEMGREEGVADPKAHNYKELKSEPATCQYAKYVWYVCEDCGFEMGREEGVADPDAHNYKELKSEPATCQYAEYVWYVCEDCGFEMGREEGVADPDAHNYKELKSEPATCQYAEYVWYVCEDCGFEMGREEGKPNPDAHTNKDGDNKCDDCGYKLFEDCDHEGTETFIFTIEANCSKEGLVQEFCAVCEEMISEEVLAKNDNHFFHDGKCLLCGETDECKHNNLTMVKSEPATCQYAAYVWYVCDDCGWEMGREEGVADPDAHNYKELKSEPATCQYAKYVWYVCEDCGFEMGREEGAADPDAHNYKELKSEPATCQYAEYVWYVCEDCGWEMGREEGVADPDAHNYKELKSEPATCQYAEYVWYVCEDCGFEMGREEGVADPKAHNYKELKSEPATCQYAKYVWYVCEDCGFEMGREEGVADPDAHNYKELKSEPATCQYAKYVWYVCEDCGFEMGREEGVADPKAHTNNDGDNLCDDCGYKLFEDCDHEGTETFIFTIEANCSKEGLVQEFCAVCEEMISEEVLAKNDNHFFHDGKCLLCGETDECKHNNLTMVKSEPATCQYAAYVWYVCDDCGWEMGREEGVADPDAHNYKELKSEPATCQYAKYVWYVCENCGFEMGREEGAADPKAHNYKELKSEPATCQYAKYVWYVCEDCGFEMGREEGVADASAHKWDDGKVTTEPTVDAEGVKTFTCSDCGKTKTEAIDKISHAHDYKSVVTASTCTKAGYTTFTCECGDSYVGNEVAALGHSEKSAGNAVEATCTTNGKEADTVCSVCGETLSEGAVIAAKGHDYDVESKEATCTEAGYTIYKCTCGDSYTVNETPALGHSFKVHWEFNDDITEKYKVSTCTTCGHVVKEGPFECDH